MDGSVAAWPAARAGGNGVWEAVQRVRRGVVYIDHGEVAVSRLGGRTDADVPPAARAPALRIGVGVLVWRGSRLLLGRRLARPGRGSWQLPGGGLRAAESAFECARREVLEETGLLVLPTAIGPCLANTVGPSGLAGRSCYVTARWIGGEARVLEPGKAAAWAWFPHSRLPRPLFLPLRRLRRRHPGLLRPGVAARG